MLSSRCLYSLPTRAATEADNDGYLQPLRYLFTFYVLLQNLQERSVDIDTE